MEGRERELEGGRVGRRESVCGMYRESMCMKERDRQRVLHKTRAKGKERKEVRKRALIDLYACKQYSTYLASYCTVLQVLDARTLSHCHSSFHLTQDKTRLSDNSYGGSCSGSDYCYGTGAGTDSNSDSGCNGDRD